MVVLSSHIAEVKMTPPAPQRQGAEPRIADEVTLAFGEGTSTPLQYSCLENPMDGGAWRDTVHGVTKNGT